MKRPTKQAALGLFLILLSGFLLHRKNAEREQRRSTDSVQQVAFRLLGPLAPIAANFTWFSAQRALAAGEKERALVLAERAVDLAPRDSLGWERYATLVGSLFASPESELDPALRLAWIRAALEIFQRGEAQSDDPGPLALARAVLLVSRVEVDPDLPWPDGPAEPWELAAQAFDQAALWKAHPAAREFAQQARAAALEARQN